MRTNKQIDKQSTYNDRFWSTLLKMYKYFVKVLFRYALGILSYMEDKLMNQGDYMSIFNTFRTEVYHVNFINISSGRQLYQYITSYFRFKTLQVN